MLKQIIAPFSQIENKTLFTRRFSVFQSVAYQPNTSFSRIAGHERRCGFLKSYITVEMFRMLCIFRIRPMASHDTLISKSHATHHCSLQRCRQMRLDILLQWSGMARMSCFQSNHWEHETKTNANEKVARFIQLQALLLYPCRERFHSIENKDKC